MDEGLVRICMPSRLIKGEHIRDRHEVRHYPVARLFAFVIIVVLASGKTRGTKTNQAMKNQP